jgi:hypothetical protein
LSTLRASCQGWWRPRVRGCPGHRSRTSRPSDGGRFAGYRRGAQAPDAAFLFRVHSPFGRAVGRRLKIIQSWIHSFRLAACLLSPAGEWKREQELTHHLAQIESAVAPFAICCRDHKRTINPKYDQIQAVSHRTARTLNPMRTAEYRGSLPRMQVHTTTPTPIICSWFESRYPSFIADQM